MKRALHVISGRTGNAWCGVGRFVKLVSILTHKATCKNCRRMLKARGL
jgi:hypothetical protein